MKERFDMKKTNTKISFGHKMVMMPLSLNPLSELRQREKQAAQASKRLLSAARLLPEASFLGLRVDLAADPAHRVSAFSDEAALLAQEDLEWVFQPVAKVETALSSGEDPALADSRLVYSLMESESTDDSTKSDGQFGELIEMLRQAGARIWFRLGAASGSCQILLSLPAEMTLRLRAMLSLALPGTDLEAHETRTAGIRKEHFSRLTESFLEWLLAEREKEKQEELHTATESSWAEDGDEHVVWDIDQILIEDLDLSIRTYNCLHRAGITRVGTLRRMSEEGFKKIRNLGRKSLDEIYAKLEGLTQAQNDAIGESAQANCDASANSGGEALQNLVGLENIKAQVRRITAFARMQKALADSGKNTAPIVLNMEFIGNPGTAKTTVARILSGALHEIGLLQSRALVEVGRADLVGHYAGQTAEKVKEVFRRAKGKLLFIDEAYSLVEHWEGSYGDEAINTIVQEMENQRAETIVIFAGYPKQMADFFARNPGLRSRVPFQLRFRDYTVDEMRQIAELEAARRGFCLSASAQQAVAKLCAAAVCREDAGNGRYCRSLIDEAMLNYAERVYGTQTIPQNPEAVLQAEDFPSVEGTVPGETPRRIGFASND